MYTNTRHRVYEKMLEFLFFPVAVAVLHATGSDSSPFCLYLCTQALMDPSFHSNDDLDPAPRQSDANLLPLVYRADHPRLHFKPQRLHCERSRPSMAPYKALAAFQF